MELGPTEEIYNGYKTRLRDAFPEVLKNDVDAVLSILPPNNYVSRNGQQIIRVENLISPSNFEVQLDNELLAIPYRIYFNEPNIEAENKLTDIQKTILHSIYLRHFDGYLRQRRLEKLVGKNDNWITPFTIQLLGEYVLEIVQVLARHVNDSTINNYVRFIIENPKYWILTESRMISYWDVYYRRKYPKLRAYPAQLLATRINKSAAAYLQ